MKKVLIGCGIAIGSVLLVAIVAIAGLFWLIKGEEQKPPQITNGEFPFVIEYEMNGETYIIEDSVVCEFDGYDLSALTDNKPRTWNEYLKSGNEEKRLFIELEPNTESVLVDNRINEASRVILWYGDGAYYMGDPEVESRTNGGQPVINYIEEYWTDSKTMNIDSTKLSNEQLEEYFGIKIKRFEFSKPIKNEFK